MSEHPLVQQVDEAYRPFRDAVDRADLDAPTSAGWTAKEMVAHVAFWKEASVGVVHNLFRGEPDPAVAFGSGYEPGDEWPVADVHNAREAAWARTQDAAAVVERLDRAHRLQCEALATVTDDERAAHAEYFDVLGDHEREHLAELAERPDPGGPVASEP